MHAAHQPKALAIKRRSCPAPHRQGRLGKPSSWPSSPALPSTHTNHQHRDAPGHCTRVARHRRPVSCLHDLCCAHGAHSQAHVVSIHHLAVRGAHLQRGRNGKVVRALCTIICSSWCTMHPNSLPGRSGVHADSMVRRAVWVHSTMHPAAGWLHGGAKAQQAGSLKYRCTPAWGWPACGAESPPNACVLPPPRL